MPQQPEKMLKMYLDRDSGIKLNVVEKELEWAQLVRIRSKGDFKFDDAKRWCIRQNNFKEFNDTDVVITGSC